MSGIDKSKELGEAVTTQTDKESAIILGSTFSSLDANFEGEVTVDAITGGHVFYSGAAEGHATVGEFLKAYAPVEKANPEHDRKLPEWSSTDSFVADQAGWNLFNLDESRQHGEIQADDETGVFATDAEAVAFVQQSAEAGSVTAAKALKLAGLPVPQVAFVPSANGVARLICDEIVTYLSKKQLDAVRGIGIKDDAGKRDVDDFCDTNMVIHAAFERFGIRDSDVIIDRYMTIWNDAWDLANGVVFRSEALPPLTAEESRVVQEVVRKPRRSLTVPRVGVPVDTNPATIDRKLPELTEDGMLHASDAAAYLKMKSGSQLEVVPAATPGAPRVLLFVNDAGPYFEVENDHENGGCWDVMPIADLGGVEKLRLFFESTKKPPETLSTLEKQKRLESLGYVFSADFKRLDKFTWESVEYGDAAQAFDSLDQVIDAAWTHQQQIQNQEEVESLTGGKLPDSQEHQVNQVTLTEERVFEVARRHGIQSYLVHDRQLVAFVESLLGQSIPKAVKSLEAPEQKPSSPTPGM